MFNKFLPVYNTDVSYRQLLEYGVHVGHSKSTSSIFCIWMVVAFRQGLYVINLYKFLHMLRIGFVILNYAIKISSPIWFINLDGSSDRYIKFPAMECGEMWVCNFWICGMLSNYETISNSYKQMNARSIILKHRRHFVRDTNYNNWAYTRFTWPRVAFVSNVFKSYQPCKEALSLQIPCLGIVDTNAKSNIVSVAIPGNDESIECLVFYNTLISNFILYRKYSKVYKWFISVRNKNRLINFKEWFDNKFSINLLSNHSLKFNLQGIFRFNYISTILRGSNLFFCKSYWVNEIREKLVIFPFYKDLDKYKTFVNLTRSSIINFFDKFSNINLILANFCFISFLTVNIFRDKTANWLKSNAWVSDDNRIQDKNNGPVFSTKSILRNFNLMRVFSKENLYMDYNSKILNVSSLPLYWREMAYKFVGILLIFSCLKYFIFYSKRFYRFWPSYWLNLHSFQYPYYILKEPSKFLNISLALFRHEKQSWNKMILASKSYKKLFIDQFNFNSIDDFKTKKDGFIQLPGKWFINDSNPNIIPFLSGFLGLNSMFPFFYSSKIELKISNVLIDIKTLKSKFKFPKKIRLNSKIIKLSELIGLSKLPINSWFTISSWSLFSSLSGYSWISKVISIDFSYFLDSVNNIMNLMILLLLVRFIKKDNEIFKVSDVILNYFMRFFCIKNKSFRIILFPSLLFGYLNNINKDFKKSLLILNYPINLSYWIYNRKWLNLKKFNLDSMVFTWVSKFNNFQKYNFIWFYKI